MIIVSLAIIKTLSDDLYKATQQYLNKQVEEETLFKSLGKLIEAHLYYNPIWDADLQFGSCRETEIQILSNNKLQINGLAYWAHQHANDFYEPAIMTTTLSWNINSSDQIDKNSVITDFFDYGIAIAYDDIHCYITPQGICYESRNDNSLPKPDSVYFLNLLINQFYYCVGGNKILEQLGEAGHKILRKWVVEYPFVLEKIIYILSCSWGGFSSCLEFEYIIEAGLQADDETVKENTKRTVLAWADSEPAYRKYLPDELRPKEFNIEDYWAYLASAPAPGFTLKTHQSKIEELVKKDASSMTRLIDCLDYKNSAALFFLEGLYKDAAPAVDKLKYLLDNATPDQYLPGNRWWAIKIFSILKRIDTPAAKTIIDQALCSPEPIKDAALIGINSDYIQPDSVVEDKAYYVTKFTALLENSESSLDDFDHFYELQYFRVYPDVQKVIQSYVQFLINKLTDKSDESDQSYTLLELRSLDEDAQAAIPYVLEIFWRQPDPKFTADDLQTMQSYRQDPSNPSIVPHLQDMAISTLSSIAIPTPEVIEALQKALTLYNINVGCPQCNEYDLCKDAIFGLIKIGQLKIVLETLKTVNDKGFIDAYLNALSYCAADMVDELLSEMSDPLIYYYGLQILPGFREKAKPALPNLMAWLKDEAAAYRPMVAICIGAIGTEASDAIPVLALMLDDKDLSISIRSAAALGKIGPASLSTVLTALDRAKLQNQSASNPAQNNLLDEVTICWLIKALIDIAEASNKADEIQKALMQWQDHADMRINFLVQAGLNKIGITNLH